mgnify:CR=1 FL=1
MGRIKTKKIKRITHDLLDAYGGEFTQDYFHNRKQVERVANIQSKKLRNTVAGYVTRLTRTQNY